MISNVVETKQTTTNFYTPNINSFFSETIQRFYSVKERAKSYERSAKSLNGIMNPKFHVFFLNCNQMIHSKLCLCKKTKRKKDYLCFK